MDEIIVNIILSLMNDVIGLRIVQSFVRGISSVIAYVLSTLILICKLV